MNMFILVLALHWLCYLPVVLSEHHLYKPPVHFQQNSSQTSSQLKKVKKIKRLHFTYHLQKLQRIK